MDQKAIDGYVRMITTTVSMLLTIILLFITDPGKQETINAFVNAMLIPAIPQIANIIFVIVRTITDMKKIEVKKELVLAGVVPAVTPQPTQNPAPTAPISAPSAPVAAPVTYLYYDEDNLEAQVREALKKGGADTAMNLAYAYRNKVLNTEMEKVSPKDRVRNARELLDRSKLLFENAFTDYTGQPLPGIKDLSNPLLLQLRVKEEYEKSHNMVCSNNTFTELKSLLNFLEDFIRIDQGLTMLEKAANLDYSNLPPSYSAFYMAEYAGSIVGK